MTQGIIKNLVSKKSVSILLSILLFDSEKSQIRFKRLINRFDTGTFKQKLSRWPRVQKVVSNFNLT